MQIILWSVQSFLDLNRRLNRRIDTWYLEWHMRLNPKKTKSMVVSRSRTKAFGYGDLILGGDELQERMSLVFIGTNLSSKLAFETQSGCAPSRKIIWLSTGAKQIFQCICFVLPGVLCPVWMSSAFNWVSVDRSAERLCEGQLCCLGHRRKVSTICLIYKISILI